MWEKVRLSEIVDTSSGGTPNRSVKEYWENGDIPWIKSGQLKDCLIDGAEEFITEKGLKSSSAKLVDKGTLLLALYGATAGKLGFLGLNATTNQAICAIKPKKENLINTKYLYYYLLSQRSEIIKDSEGGAQPNISQNYVNNIQISLPPLPIQKRIAEILDTADALRRKDEALLKKYDELAQAIFIDMFGDIMLNEKNYPIFEFGKLCEELFLGLTSKVDYVNCNGVPLIRATDINKGELSFKNVKFISQEQHKKLTARRITRRGDVLISKSGTLGTCAIVDTDEEFSTYESIFTVRPKKELLSNVFLVSLVRNPSFQEKLLGGKVGAGVAHLNLNMLRDFTLPLPPIELQDKFVSISNSIENLINVSVKSKTDSESLFNSLLQKAFNGELIV